MKRLILFALFGGLTFYVPAQSVGINATGTDPDSSSILDVQSISKGVLMPRMNSAQRDAISKPATGLWIYNTTDSVFNYWNGDIWVNIFGGNPSLIEDGDRNTRVQTEENANDNTIRFDVDGVEMMSLTNSRFTVRASTGIHMPNTFGPNSAFVGTAGNSISFGHAGVSEDFIGYFNNTFYFKDSPGGGDIADPNINVGGTVFANSFSGDGANITGLATSQIASPDIAQPVPIRYQGGFIYVHPNENATGVDWSTAQSTCNNLTAFGFSDWYLPSRLELDAMYKQSYLITGLTQAESAKYWSATELDAINAFSQRLDYGGPDPDAKTIATGHNCRCIRKN